MFAPGLAIDRVPQTVAAGIRELSDNPLVLLLLVNLLLLVVGMFIEPLAAVVVLGPILVALAIGYGLDPVHFAMIVIANLAIGMATPSVGVSPFVVSRIANTPIEGRIPPLPVFLAVLTVDPVIITFVPALSLAFVR